MHAHSASTATILFISISFAGMGPLGLREDIPHPWRSASPDETGPNAFGTDVTSDADVIRRCYFFLPEAKLGCHPAVFWLGAAAIVLIFSFLGFLDSRLPFCSPLAISLSLLFDSD